MFTFDFVTPAWYFGAKRTSLAIAVASVCSTAAYSQSQLPGNRAATSSEASEPVLKSVVVTATRSDLDIADAPAAVSVITRQDINNRNVSRITDALQKVPSLYLGRGENGQNNSTEGGFSLRGMSTNRTLVLLDGLQPLQNGNSQGVNWLTVFVDDVERVEVVPGAFGALYGSNAMGGVINMISKRPDKREFTVRLKKGFSDAQGEDVSVYFRDKLASGLGINVGLAHNRRDGYSSELTVRTPVTGAAGTPVSGAIPTTTREGVPAFIVGDRGEQPWLQRHLMAKLSYDINAVDRIYAGVALADMETGYTRFNSYLTNTATGAPVSSGTLGINGQRVTLSESNFLGATPATDSSKRYFLGYEGLMGKDMKLKVDVARIARDFAFPQAGTTATATAGAGSLTDSPNTGLSAVATLSFPVADKHFIVTGLSYQEDAVERRSYALTNWRDRNSKTTTNNGYNGTTKLFSFFAQDEYQATDRLTLYAGARVDRWTTQGDFFQNTAPIRKIDYAQRGETAFNPKLSGVFKATDAVTLRASWGQSFRAPSNLDLYSTTVQTSSVSPTGFLTIQSDPNMKPERGTSWELGGEWRINDQFKTTATYYQTRLKDMIYSKQINLSLTQRINAGESEVKGLELGMAAKLAPRLELNANTAFIDSRILANLADPGSVGKRLTQVPKRTSYAGLTASQGPWSGTLEARYSAQTYITALNTDTVQGVPGSNDAHTMVNLKAGYQFNRMTRLNFAVNNLFNTQAYVFAKLPSRNATAELVLSF
jgi:iron complex outermembrane recepter protein